MKKIITVLLGMLVFTLGSSSVLAMESEISDPRPSGVISVEHNRTMMIIGIVFVMIVGAIYWKIFNRYH